MATKSSPGLIQRFTGRAGRVRFIEALRGQEIVAGDQRVAQALATAAIRQEFPANREILTQGNSDNDICFILSILHGS
jgi:hypothetical protein